MLLKMENSYDNKNEVNTRPLTREEEIELNYNSVKRIEPFLIAWDKWYEEMAISLRKNSRALSYVA